MLLSVLSFMFLLLFSTFILLQNGIYLQNISFQNIKVKKLYIKWDEKITLNAKEISITKDRSNEDSNVEYEKILQIIKEILPFTSWLKELHVEKILLSDIEGSVKYIDDKEGYLNLASESFTLNSSLLSKNGSLEIGIKELKSLNKKLKINGNFIINTKRVDIYIIFKHNYTWQRKAQPICSWQHTKTYLRTKIRQKYKEHKRDSKHF